jgi:hypothetical protein
LTDSNQKISQELSKNAKVGIQNYYDRNPSSQSGYEVLY